MALDLPADKDGLDLLEDLLGQFVTRGAGRVVTLNLHRHVELLIAVLPNVRLIHLLRDPRDVALSSIAMGWAGTLYHAVGHWLLTERSWDGIADRLAPGQALTLKFKGLVRESEASLRMICQFLDVPFDQAMLEYHRSTSYLPPDASLVDQWRRTARPLDLAQLEARAGDLMICRGYVLSGEVNPPGAVTVVLLGLRNRMSIWRFSVRRFGLFLYFGEKIARRMRLTKLCRRLQDDIEAIIMRNLK
jgi:hypothetical protein